MTAPVEIPIVLKGLTEAKQAIGSLRDVLVKMEIDTLKMSSNYSKKRIKVYQNEIAQKEKMLTSAQKLVDMQMDKGLSGGSRRTLGSQKTGVTTPSFATGIGNMDMGGLAKMATFAGGVGLALGVMKGALDMAIEGLKQFGSFLLTDIVKPQFELETFAVQLENSTNGQVKAQKLMDVSNTMQAKWNINAIDAAKAIEGLINSTGDAKLGMEMIDYFAQLNKGYGADIGQLSGLASAMYEEGMSTNDIKTLIGTQLAQGQITGGKFTLKQVAALGGEFTRGQVNLAGNEDFRMASIGAAFQTGGIAGKSDMSMNNLNKFMEEAAGGKGATIGKTKENQIADLGDAIRANLVASKGNANYFKTAGYSDPSQGFLKQYLSKFNEAKKGGKNDKEAATVATQTFEDMRKAVADETTIRAAANKTMQTSGEKWDSAINRIKDKLLEIMPAVEKFVDDFSKMAPDLANSALLVAQALTAMLGPLAWILKKFGFNAEDAAGDTHGKWAMNVDTGKWEFKKDKGDAEEVNAFDQISEKNTSGKIKRFELPGSYKPNESSSAKNWVMADDNSQTNLPSSVVNSFIGPPTGQNPSQGPSGIEAAINSQLTPSLDKTKLASDALSKSLKETALANDAANNSRVKPINER